METMSLKNKIRRFHRRNLSLGYYPGSFRSAFVFVLGFTMISLYTNVLSSVKPVDKIVRIAKYTTGDSDITTHALAGLIIWMILGTIRKMILRKLLTYRGWMLDGRSPSLKTKIFVVSLRLLSGWSKPISSSLYDLQKILPTFPVPAVKDTVAQYLESMQPLVETKKLQELQTFAQEFVQKTGSKLQRYLILKSWLAPNYISDWWEDYVYLKCRGSLLIDSNYYAVDALQETTQDQASRAALLTYSAMLVRKSIEDCNFEPIIAQGVIPLCSWQYERMFNTTRIPGKSMDTLQHEQFSDHVTVQHKGRYFKVNVYHDLGRKKLLSPAELRLQYVRILADTSEPDIGENKLAALTAWDRTNWARARETHFQGLNKLSLDSIEKSALVVNLDDEDLLTECLKHPGKTTPDYTEYSRNLMHGNGCNRWLDKSVNFMVFKNGRAGGGGEHSWGDAPVGAHMWEICLRFGLDFDQFDKNGVITSPIETVPPHPEKLRWELSEECLEDIDNAAKEAWKAIDNFDLKVLVFSSFGKGLMKKCQVSPDAFLQMALQLAYYRDQGKFDLTYEASMTRLYLQGRTETVRVCTTESCDWVRSMEEDLPREEKVELFQKACKRHQNSYRAAMNGKGIDRHLFGLFVVSKYLEIDSPFLNEALGLPWRLSTSQTPVQQTNMKPTTCWGGGFGPVAPDGYGVSYIISGEDLLYFHVSSKKSASNTDSEKFSQQIERALWDIRGMFSA